MKEITKKIKESNLPKFSKKVYLTLLKIPKGKVTTYKVIANAMGTTSYRAVGGVIAKNPFIPYVPCHRVVASNRSLHGYMHGLQKKAELLRSEGIIITNGLVDSKYVLKRI